jgi:hypothetical protein
MSQKEEILELLKDGASYDRVEQSTGAERGYIRQIASQFRQRDKEVKVPDETNEPEGTPKKEDPQKGKKVGGESLEFEEIPEKTWDDSKGKNGMDYHKEWVKEKKYECNCGCTLNRKGDFCPHCGTTLDWSGVD